MIRVDEGEQDQTANKSNQPPQSKKMEDEESRRDFIITAQIDPAKPKVLRAALC